MDVLLIHMEVALDHVTSTLVSMLEEMLQVTVVVVYLLDSVLAHVSLVIIQLQLVVVLLSDPKVPESLLVCCVFFVHGL